MIKIAKNDNPRMILSGTADDLYWSTDSCGGCLLDTNVYSSLRNEMYDELVEQLWVMKIAVDNYD